MSIISIQRLDLNAGEIQEIEQLIAPLAAQPSLLDDPAFLVEAPVYAHSLPRRLRLAVNQFRLQEAEPSALVVSGIPIDDAGIGPTPPHWKRKDVGSDAQAWREEAIFVIIASLLGDIFGWLTQQDGQLVHDIVPVFEHEHASIETGSRHYIMWHNDDAYHPHRADYLLMMCLRNPDATPTTVGAPDMARLDPRHLPVLFAPRFCIWPDLSHHFENRLGTSDDQLDAATREAYQKISGLLEHAEHVEKVSVLYGDPASPYVRIDSDSMSALPGDAAGAAAFAALVQNIDDTLVDIALRPGDILIIDNHRVVHGRRPFRARYDGTDRWMKRLGITRDLRRSRTTRLQAGSRLLR